MTIVSRYSTALICDGCSRIITAAEKTDFVFGEQVDLCAECVKAGYTICPQCAEIHKAATPCPQPAAG